MVARRVAERAGEKKTETRLSLTLCRHDASDFTDIKCAMSQKGQRIGG